MTMDARGSESGPNFERLAIRMLHRVCPGKGAHGEIGDGHCPECGISQDDYDRFVVGDEGKWVRPS